jgi:hypothetical protein
VKSVIPNVHKLWVLLALCWILLLLSGTCGYLEHTCQEVMGLMKMCRRFIIVLTFCSFWTRKLPSTLLNFRKSCVWKQSISMFYFWFAYETCAVLLGRRGRWEFRSQGYAPCRILKREFQIGHTFDPQYVRQAQIFPQLEISLESLLLIPVLSGSMQASADTGQYSQDLKMDCTGSNTQHNRMFGSWASIIRNISQVGRWDAIPTWCCS